jgi:DNA-binding transcriptional MerR regulator
MCSRPPESGAAEGKAAYIISAVAEQYAIHPQTLRLYEREGLLAPSRSEANTRLYTDEDLKHFTPRLLTTGLHATGMLLSDEKG